MGSIKKELSDQISIIQAINATPRRADFKMSTLDEATRLSLENAVLAFHFCTSSLKLADISICRKAHHILCRKAHHILQREGYLISLRIVSLRNAFVC